MEQISKLLHDLGSKGGIGLFLAFAGAGIGFFDKLDFNNVGSSLKTLPPGTIVAVLCVVIGLALLGNQIYDLQEKCKSLEGDRKRFEELSHRTTENDQNVLADLATEFASHRLFYVPLDYENIGEAIESAGRLRAAVKTIVAKSDAATARAIAQRAEFFLQNFITETDELERNIGSTADAYISAYKENRELESQRETRETYQRLALKNRILSKENNIVALGGVSSLSALGPDFALDFVRALYRLRGGFQEIFFQIERAGVNLPSQLR